MPGATVRIDLQRMPFHPKNWSAALRHRTNVKSHLLLVDYENVHKIDLSQLDESYRAIIFVGAGQNPPKAARKPATAHRFRRVEFQKITGSGKNALDFHIAFQLGRTFETATDTVCVVVSRDKGYDPLLQFLNENGLSCRRIDSFEVLFAEVSPPVGGVEPSVSSADVVCRKCGQSRTIELHGGRWCINCGSFASPPDPNLLPSNQPGYREPPRARQLQVESGQVCGWCDEVQDMSDGLYDDGEWMCGACIAEYAR